MLHTMFLIKNEIKLKIIIRLNVTEFITNYEKHERTTNNSKHNKNISIL